MPGAANDTRAQRTARFGSARHLSARFVASLWPAGPRAQDERWARGQLLEGERELWRRMSRADRRHAVRVARRAADLLEIAGEPPRREIIAAALLHDVGKITVRLGAIGRVAVTLAGIGLGSDRLGPATRLPAGAARYLAHDALGAELLREAGSDPLTVAWAEQHHLPPARWTIDGRIGGLLKQADGS